MIPASSDMPLLLLPGTVCDARVFAPMLDRLDAAAHVADMTLAQTTPDLAAAILAVAPERFSLLGFSLGGIVALEMMAQAPDRVLRLALLDTTPRPDPQSSAAKRRAAVARARVDGMDRYILDAWDTLVSPTNAGREELRQLIVAMARDAGPDVLERQSAVAIHRADSRPRLGAIAVPTLIVAGADERVCPLDAHQELATGIAGARYVTLANAGHYALLEQPAAVAALARDWLSWI